MHILLTFIPIDTKGSPTPTIRAAEVKHIQEIECNKQRKTLKKEDDKES